MQNLMTFNEMLEKAEAESIILYPSEVDETTKSQLRNYFYYRKVVDNEKFPLYFYRRMDRIYSQYRQLLRIEAGKTGDSGKTTSFDWLVSNYNELYDLTRNETTSEAETHQNITKTGSTGQGGTTRTVTENDNINTYNTTNATTISGQNSQNSTNTRENGSTTTDRNRSLARTAPTSASYTDGELASDYVGSVGTAGNAIAVGEITSANVGNVGSVIGLNRNFPELKIKNPTSAADTLDNTSNVGYEKNTNSLSGTNTGTNTTTNTGTVSSDNDVTQVITHGMTTTSTGADNTTGTSEGTTLSEILHELQSTGRNGEIAEMLKRASDYVKNSSALKWLCNELEPCFFALYEFD